MTWALEKSHRNALRETGARAVRGALREGRQAWRRARFDAWVARLRVELRRNGGRLELDAPHGAYFEELPVIRVSMQGVGDGAFKLRIGRGVRVGRGCVLEVWAGASNVLEIGDHAIIEDDVNLRLFGGAIRLGSQLQLRDHVRCKSSGGELVVGHKVVLSSFVIVHCAERIEVHDYAAIAERSTLIDSDHGVDGGDEHFLDAPIKTTPIVVGRNAFCGTGTTILRGARIGRSAAVAAGAVVLGGDYPAGWLITGSPAVPRKPLPATVARDPQGANGSLGSPASNSV